MKYVQPYGISDPDAPYINGDPSIARMGSIPPAAAFEHPMRELVAIEEYSLVAPSEDDLEQVAKSIRSQRMNYVEDTGSANTLSVSFDPPLVAYTIGYPIRVKIKVTNTGPSTIDAGAGRVSVKKPNGAEMAAGDLPASGLAEMVFDGTNFQMINFGGAGGGAGGDIYQINIPYCVDSSVTANTVIANFSPALTTYAAGMIFMVKIANTNTNFSNINVNGLGLKSIYAQGGSPNWPLLPSDMVAGDVLIFTYDGTRFWIYANNIINQNVTLNVSNNTQIDELFVALGRKRILKNAAVTIQMATGIYSAFRTYHVDASRITVKGTMLAAVPTSGNFSRTGNTPAARANDSANNIAMLRTRYGTEVRFVNDPGVGIQHEGPGTITYSSLLVTGANVSAGAAQSIIGGIGPDAGSSLNAVDCAVWGSGGYGFSTSAAMQLFNCYACGNHYHGVFGGQNAQIYLMGGGYFGNATHGVAAIGSYIFCYGRTGVPGAADIPGVLIQFNGICGVSSDTSSTIYVRLGTVVGNASIDMRANYASQVVAENATYGTISPAANTTGNSNSISTVM